jgi:hypothetical protein
MPRDLIAEIDPILTTLRQKLNEFIQRRGLLSTPLATLEAEQELAALGRHLADQIMALLLLASIEHRQEQAPQDRDRAVGRRKTRAVGRRTTPIRLLGGMQLSIKTSYRLPVRKPRKGRRRGVGRRGRAGAGHFPHLVGLGVLCGATPAVLSEVARQAAESSSLQVAKDNLDRRGLDLVEAG